MKHLSILLLVMLLLSSCGVPAAPAQPAGPASAEDTSSDIQAKTSLSSSASPEAEASSQEQTPPPMPDKMPEATSAALKLPASLAVKTEGWDVSLVTPAQYLFEMPLNRGGYRGFLSCDYFVAVQDGKTTYFNTNGKQISEPGTYELDQDAGWYAQDGIATVKKDGLYGLMDAATGESVLPVEYSMARAWPAGFYEVQEPDQTTKLLRRNDLSVAFTFERGETFELLGKDYLTTYQNGTLKVLKKDGTPVKNMVCDEYAVVGTDDSPLGVNRLVVRENGKYGLYDENLNPITNAVYERFNHSFQGDYISFSKSGKWGIMDYSGQVTISPKWDDIILYQNSASLCLDNKWLGTMDLSSDIKELPIYDFVGPYSESGFASFEKNGKYGLLDEDGNVMMTPRQSGDIISGTHGFDEDVFLIQGENGPGSYGIMCDGQMVLPTETIVYSQGVNPYFSEDEEYNLVCLPSGKWGYVDSRGQYVIDAKFDNADGFIAGKDIAMVSLGGKICLIDRKGNVVLETVFTDCIAFCPETMVCAMRYTDASGQTADCLVRLTAQS